ncbi:MAG TPA: outer membrane beta-barrel protein [Bryobacteraceae bacterium]
MRCAVCASALLAFAVCAPGASFHFGVYGGVPLTHYFDTGSFGSRFNSAEYSAATRRYTLGASAEWRFDRAVGLETGVFYHRMGYVAIVNGFSFSGVQTNAGIDIKGNSWDFPLTLKYRLGRPFVLGGGILRYVGPVRGLGEQTEHDLITGTVTTTPLDTTEPTELRKRFYPGVTFGAGIEIGRSRLRIAPEFRYTRWTANITSEGGSLRFTPNQAEILLGIVF